MIKVQEYIRIDEKNHVEEPFLLQLQAMEQFNDGLGCYAF